MTIDEFVTKWTGQTVDTDGVYPNQCMDLMHQYCIDCLGITDSQVLAAPSAAQVYTNFTDTAQFDKIDNTPTGVPSKGDILFFGTTVGPYGHVCIFLNGDSNNFNSFDSNWPLGTLPHTQSHNYSGVIGWLHPKVTAPETVVVPKADFEKLVTKSDAYDAFVRAGYSSAQSVANMMDALHQDNFSLQKQNTDLGNQLGQCKTDYNVAEGQLTDAEDQIRQLKQQLASQTTTPSHKEFVLFGRTFWILD